MDHSGLKIGQKMNNELKETIKFFIFCFVTCVVVKYALSHFVFNSDILISSLIISFFGALGWHLGRGIKINKKK